MMKISGFLIIAISFFASAIAAESEEKLTEEKVVYFFPCFWGNEIFNPGAPNDTFYNLEALYGLHRIAKESGFDLRVADGCRNELRDVHGNEPEFPKTFYSIVVFEVTHHQLKLLEQYPSEKLNLILWEPPTTMLHNYFPENHRIFSRVYTWRDDLVDNKKYFKIFYPVLRPMVQNAIAFEDRKLCVLVAGNKKSSVQNELYTEKRNIVKFFEENHPEDFDLYGGGWPSEYKTNKGVLAGNLASKVEKLKEYRFGIAYENGKELPGYITEKIFDCFTAGIVPIYWGAPNVASYIPKECFVARENFKNNEELYAFLKGMSKDRYAEYIKNIQLFLNSDQAKVFSSENFQKIMMEMLTRPIEISEPKAEVASH